MIPGGYRSKGRATVVEDPTLQRDLSTRAVINTNQTDYSRRLALKRSMREKDSALHKLQEEIQDLKTLVTQLLQVVKNTQQPDHNNNNKAP